MAKNKSEPDEGKKGSAAGRPKRTGAATPDAGAELAGGYPGQDESTEQSGEVEPELDDSAAPSSEEPELVEAMGEIVEDDAAAVSAIPTRRGYDPMVDTPESDQVALSRTDPLQAYLREVQRHPLLTPDEEKTLTTHYAQTQDVQTAARLVTANLRLVVKLAYEYRLAYKNIMDLIQEGNIGLMQAVKRYDPYRGVRLSSYAAWWIRAYILRFILNNWRLVKLGTTQAQRKLFFNLSKEKAKLTAMGIDPTPAEIGRRLNVDEKEVIEMDNRLAAGDASLDVPAAELDGRGMPRVELIPSSQVTPDMAFEASEMGTLVRERLEEFRKTLTGKDAVIFDKRMTAEEPLTLQDLGNEFGISRERVRQLEARLTGKLRAYLKEELGDAVDAS